MVAILEYSPGNKRDTTQSHHPKSAGPGERMFGNGDERVMVRKIIGTVYSPSHSPSKSKLIGSSNVEPLYILLIVVQLALKRGITNKQSG